MSKVAKIAKCSRSTVVNAGRDIAKEERRKAKVKTTTDAKPDRHQRAQHFLRGQLSDGPKPVSDIEAAALKAHIDIPALESARGTLGIVTSRANAGGAQGGACPGSTTA